MKILLVVHGFPPECTGGTELYALRLAKELAGAGHKVEVLTGSHEGRPEVQVERYEHEGIRVHKLHRSGLFVDDWDKSYAPEIEPAIDSVLDAFRPDLVHVHHWIRLSRHVVELFHDRGIPAVCTLHDLWTTCPIAFRVRRGSFCALPAGAAHCHDCAPHGERADDAENAEGLELFREDFRNELALVRRAIVPSRAHRAEVLRHHPDIAGKIRVVPHGAISDMKPASRPEAGRGPAKLRIGHWGHLSKLKGIDILLEAAASLPAPVQDKIELHVFGTIVYPDERPAIEALAKRARAVLHRFSKAEIASAALDLAVIPTRCSESHSFVLDEAFLLGLPAIVPARGALAERIGAAGATFEPENPASLARVLAAVADSPQVLDAWRAAVPPVRPFSAHLRDVLAVYHEALSSKAPLPTTPPPLLARRARFRSLQVEARNRRLEHLEGARKNLAQDVARASATMREMQGHHVEKDKVIADLAAGSERARETVRDLERRLREKEDVIAGLRTERDRLDSVMPRLSDAEKIASRLGAEIDQVRIEMNEAARAAAAREQQILSRAERAEQQLLSRSERADADRAEREALLAESARALEAATDRIAEAGRRAQRVREPARAEGTPSLIDRIKRKAFGDDREPAAPLRVLYVLHQFLPRHVAGTELYTFNLAREVRGRGAHVAILTCEAHHDRQPFEYSRREYDGLPVHEVVHNYKWASFEETYDSPRADAIFERVLDEERPDVVHIQHLHYFSANFIGIARRRGIPVVYTLHDYSILCARDGQLLRADGELCTDAVPAKCADCIGHHMLDSARGAVLEGDAGFVPPALRRVLLRMNAGLPPLEDRAAADPRERYVEAAAVRLAAWRRAVRDVDLFVSPSRFLKDLFVGSGMIAEDAIVVSPNGHDLGRFEDLPPRVRGPALRFGYVGSIAEHKGVHVLVEAMNGLRDQPAATCRIYGDLTAFVEYTERLRALSTNPRTELMGPFSNDDVARVLSAIDVLVIPSLWFENAPLTIQEAALARVPVIASDHGGLAEHVVEGRNGLLFYAGDAEDLRKKLVWFIEDFSRCDRFDFASVPVVSIQEDAARTEKRYLDLIAARR